jgi:hypothetical protein
MPLPKPTEAGTKLPYIKLTEGAHRVRIVSEPIEEWTHFLPAEKKSVKCWGHGKCPHCDEGVKARKQYYFNAIDRDKQMELHKTGKEPLAEVELLIVGSTVYEQYYALSMNDDWAFDSVPHFDVVIKRTGTGLNDTQYFVQPCPAKPLSASDLSVVNAAKSIQSSVNQLLGLKDENPIPAGGPAPVQFSSENPPTEDYGF